MKNTDTAALKDYEAGKKVSGIKRNIAVDTQGLPHAIAGTTTVVTGRKGAIQALQCCKGALSRVQALLCDGGLCRHRLLPKTSKTYWAHTSTHRSPRATSFTPSR